MIPQNITKEHVLQAIQEIEKSGVPENRSWRKFKLNYNGKFYPPKYTIAIANKFANQQELDPNTFSGGDESNGFLESLGFKIVKPLQQEEQLPSKSQPRSSPSHNERCSECKNVIIEMFRKIYGNVKVDHKIDISSRIEDYIGKSFYDDLKNILVALQGYRGHTDFVRLRNLHRCDLFVPNPGFIVEFDESQTLLVHVILH